MIELGMAQVYASVEEALSRGDLVRAEQLCYPALDQFTEDPQLHFYAATIFTKRGCHQVARLCVQRCIDLLPGAQAYGNLGAILRRLNLQDASEESLRKAIGYNPDDANSWNNLAANYVNEGNPLPGIKASMESLRLKPDMLKAKWNLGLLQLEAGRFKEGWENYRVGLVEHQRMLRSYTKDGFGEPVLLETMSQLTQYQVEHLKRPRVIVWGEQGLGDEIMFSTMLPDLNLLADIIFECHPRLEPMMRRTYTFVKEFYPTRKESYMDWPNTYEPAQFKCALGDLGALFRNSMEDFIRSTFSREYAGHLMKADTDLTSSYREMLELMYPGKRFVGVAWTGGVISTMRWYRSCQLTELYDLGKPDDVVLVSLQYEDDAAAIVQYIEKTGRPMLRFPAITYHYDYDHTLALIQACDEVVTVCQTVAHLAAAAGVKTSVLVPDKPAWRYGLTGSDWYWYGKNAKLYRRPGADWRPAIDALMFDRGISPLPAHEEKLMAMIPKYTPRTMLELGAKQMGRYKDWFEYNDWSHLSVDLNGMGRSLRLDLQMPIDHLGEFDVVTNFGTTEHVENQTPVWENIHKAVRVGGYLISTTPFYGDWPDHGRWYPSELFYAEFAVRNGYDLLYCEVMCEAPKRMVCAVMHKRSAFRFTMPAPTLIHENKSEKAKIGEYV